MTGSYTTPILLYHRIVNAQSPIGKQKIYVWEKKFREQMIFLKKNNYETITFHDLPNTSNAKRVLLTFDDGYEDNYTILFPILKEFGFKAVIYLVTKCSYNEWATKEGEPELKLMNKEMIREMRDYGIEFGGHTRTHIDLKKTPNENLYEEISGCKKDLEDIIEKTAISFAYPFGAYNDETLQAVRKAGYQYGITTIFGPKQWQDDRMRIRRIEVRPNTTLWSFKNKVSGKYFERSIFNFYLGK